LPDRQPHAAVVGSSLPIFIDLETRSACDLKKLSGRPYASHPSTEIISTVAMIDNQVVVWLPTAVVLDVAGLWPSQLEPVLPISIYAAPEVPEPLRAAMSAGRPFCAHNAFGFDALVWRAKQLPEPLRWIDTVPLARAAGLPGELDALGVRLFGIGKDNEGARLVSSINQAARRGNFEPLDPVKLRRIVQYNIHDVMLLAGLYHVVHGMGEPDVIAADRAINDRGVAFDAELARKLIRLSAATVDHTGRKVAIATNGEVTGKDLRRVDFILEWVDTQGVSLPDLQRHSMEHLLNSGALITPAVHSVLAGRLAISRTTVTKLERAIAGQGVDGRLRDQFKYHGAHTGRWSGQHVQLQNLPRPHPELSDVSQLLALVDKPDEFVAAIPAGLSLADGVSALIRPCFCAAPGNVLCIADFAGVEARGVAWCAGESRQLELFAQGGDNYCDLATEIFGRVITSANKRERAVGKRAVLGCGYGMGAERFAATCRALDVDLAAANTSAEAVIETYRDRYPAIAGHRSHWQGKSCRKGGLWRLLERAARLAIEGRGPVSAGKCTFIATDGDLIVRLPSGRLIFFRNAHLKPVTEAEQDSTTLYGSSRSQIVYDSPTATNVPTYGGELTENIVSAICRDLLARSLVACEAAGLPVVLHIHDEIVVEVRASEANRALQTLLTIMSAPPTWAKGFPIEVEGFVAHRYCKTPPPESLVRRARLGKVLPY
jgi:DNA polymerase